MGKLFSARSALRRALIVGSTVVAGLALPGTAQATVQVGPAATADPCTNFTFNVVITACAGGYDKNLLKGNASDATSVAALLALGAPGTGIFLEKLEGLSPATDLINFGTLLTGTTVFGLHAGNAGGAGGTFFFLFDAGDGVDVIEILGRSGANNSGLSNAALFQTGGAGSVPEPGTWAMMLLGFGAMGVSLRRRRRPMVQSV